MKKNVHLFRAIPIDMVDKNMDRFLSCVSQKGRKKRHFHQQLFAEGIFFPKLPLHRFIGQMKGGFILLPNPSSFVPSGVQAITRQSRVNLQA